MTAFSIALLDADAAPAMSVLVRRAIEQSPDFVPGPRLERLIAQFSVEGCADELATGTVFGAFAGEVLIGVVLVDGSAAIAGLYVDPTWQGRGAGRALTQQAEQHLERSRSHAPPTATLAAVIVSVMLGPALALAAQLIYVLLLVPQLPAEYGIAFPGAFGRRESWPVQTADLIVAGWVGVITVTLASALSALLHRGGRSTSGEAIAAVGLLFSGIGVALHLGSAIATATDPALAIPLTVGIGLGIVALTVVLGGVLTPGAARSKPSAGPAPT